MNSSLHTIIWSDDARIGLITDRDADHTFLCVTETMNGVDRKFAAIELTADKMVELRDELTRHIALHRVTA